MALDTEGLKGAIEELLKSNQSIASNEELTIEQQEKVIQDSITSLASGLADAIEVFVKSGVVKTDVNTDVKTTGSAAAQTGNGIGKGTGEII